MRGKRVHVASSHELNPGEYSRTPHGWRAMTPNGHLASLDAHDVAENPDGTITVSPSIKVMSSRWDETKKTMVPCEVWHGYLERGEWLPA